MTKVNHAFTMRWLHLYSRKNNITIEWSSPGRYHMLSVWLDNLFAFQTLTLKNAKNIQTTTQWAYQTVASVYMIRRYLQRIRIFWRQKVTVVRCTSGDSIYFIIIGTLIGRYFCFYLEAARIENLKNVFKQSLRSCVCGNIYYIWNNIY